MADTRKKTAAKKAPAKQAAPAKQTPAKKAPAAKPAAKKPAAKKPAALQPGDTLMVTVDPRQNNGSPTAAGQVVRVLDVAEERVNLQVLLDNSEGRRLVRNVPVLSKAPKEGDEDAPKVYALRP